MSGNHRPHILVVGPNTPAAEHSQILGASDSLSQEQHDLELAGGQQWGQAMDWHLWVSRRVPESFLTALGVMGLLFL